MIDEGKQDTFADSEALYTACRNQDPEAYEFLWTYLFRVALYVLADQRGANALAQDCSQEALIRIYHRIEECREPKAFRTWSRRIVAHLAIDRLRYRKRLLPLPNEEPDKHRSPLPASEEHLPEVQTAKTVDLEQLRQAIDRAPISDRSRRVVVGRYLDDLPDEVLAHRETQLAGKQIRPSHIQVTRSKNIAKLRNWEGMNQFYNRESSGTGARL